MSNFINKFKFILGLAPSVQAVEQIDYKEAPSGIVPMSVQSAHGALSRAIERGDGERPLFIEVCFLDGQTSGKKIVPVLGIDPSGYSMGQYMPGYILKPASTLAHLRRDTFHELMQYREACGDGAASRT